MQHIQHNAGIYGFFAGLAQMARKEPEQALRWWETGAMCERRYRMGEQWYNVRPDALAEYRVESQQMGFWLEWDRGTMNVRDLAIKFSSYAHFIASREWLREDARVPRLFCVAPDIAQERRVQRVTQERSVSSPGLVLWTDYRSAAKRVRASCSYLVAGHTRVRSSRIIWQCAQTRLVGDDFCVESHVR